jgi:hypothetical protein
MEHEDPLNGVNEKSDSTFLLGPVVERRFAHHFFVETAYLATAADYKVSDVFSATKADRSDIDLLPAISSRLMWAPISDISRSTRRSRQPTGPVAGIRGDVPMTGMFGLCANFSYLWTKTKMTDPAMTLTENAPGSIFELGVKAEISKALSAILGYKLESTKGDKTKEKDTFFGPTLGVMYAF